MQTHWDQLARDHANAIQRQAPDPMRGAAATATPGVCLAFGNDDYAHDHRARLGVTLLRQHLANVHLVELGFSTSDEGRCWVMVLQTNDADALRGAVLDTWRIAFDIKG